MSDRNNRPGFSTLLTDTDSAIILAFAMLLAGASAGWAGRSVLAGEPLTDQLWLVVVAVGLATALYAQASDPGSQ